MTAVLLCGTFEAAAQTQAPVDARRETPRAFSRLFEDTVADFRGLTTPSHAKILAVGALAAAAALNVDGAATDMLARPQAGFLAPGETIGSARAQLAGALATYALGHATGNATITAVGADLVSANIVAQTLTSAIKLSVRRERPDGTRFSFPSGHTSVSFAAATVLHRHFGWKAGVPGYALASYVAASRIHDRRHFLSDVAFGAAVGIVSGWSVTLGRGDESITMTPVATPGGAGLSVVW